MANYKKRSRGLLTQPENVDFTKFRRGSKPYGNPIEYCPMCKRKGEQTMTRPWLIQYIHAGRVNEHGALSITSYCLVTIEEQPHGEAIQEE